MHFLKRAAATAALTLAATTGLSVTTVAPASAGTSYADRVEAQVIKQANDVRSARGLRTVKPQACVDRYAEAWSVYLARESLFEHRDLYTLLNGCDLSYASENLAKYPVVQGMTPSAVAKKTTRLWMNSPGHRANLLSTHPRLIGAGVRKSADGKYWVITQNFGRG